MLLTYAVTKNDETDNYQIIHSFNQKGQNGEKLPF